MVSDRKTSFSECVRPGDGHQIGAEVVARHNLFDIIGPLQLQRQAAQLWNVVIDRAGGVGEFHGAVEREFACDFTHAGGAHVVAGDVDAQPARGFEF